MSVTARAATPSPPRSLHTPPAPRLGYCDSWEPYSPPRKSARIASQPATNRTPSPRASQRQQLGSPRTKKRSDHQAATMSPMHSPRKKSQPAPPTIRRAANHSLTARGTATAAEALGFGELLTPAKTPQKPPKEETSLQIKSFARNLFPQEAAMPSPKKARTKKYSGMTLESFTAEEVEADINIFVDSEDRLPQDTIPKKDESAENPFLETTIDGPSSPPPGPTKRTRRQVVVPGEGVISLEEAASRKDGMVYVFRGKKFWRPFTESEDKGLKSATNSRPIARQLFKVKSEPILDDEEEAETDVEDAIQEEAPAPATPKKDNGPIMETPKAPKFAPVSPPSTRRVTRSANKLMDSPPRGGTGRRSPFDSWQRTKEHKAPQGTKRPSDALPTVPAKRSRV